MLKENPTNNGILSCLPEEEKRSVWPRLEAVELPVRTRLERAHRPIEHVYFLESGIASVLATAPGERSIEVGLIGHEGATGMAIAMGATQTPQETFMQVGGAGRRIATEPLVGLLDENGALRRCMLLYAHVFSVQAAQTCLSNGRSKLEERLARWLLMAQDRLGGSELKLTHEFLAYMLGVRRPGVSVALKLLESRGLLKRRRGAVVIVDREGLEKCTNGAYGTAEAEFERLFGVAW